MLVSTRDLRAEVRRLLGEGAPFFSIPDLVKLPKYESLPTYDLFIKPNVWTFLSEQIVVSGNYTVKRINILF